MLKYFILGCVLLLALAGCSEKSGGIKVTNLTETEPNNDKTTAQAVAHGAAVQGYIGEPMDQDYFRLQIPPDSSAILRATLTGVTGLNLKMELFDAADDLLAEADKNKEGGGEILTNRGLTSGDYFLRVRELWLKNQVKKANDSTFYVLQIQLSAASDSAEFEPNNRGVEANRIRAGQAVSGYLSPDADADWFKLQLPKAGHSYLAISLSGVDEVDTRLAVYDPIEALILEKNGEGKGRPELIPNLGIDPAVDFYYLVVAGSKWQSNETLPYQLKAEFREVAGNIEIEPNDRLVRATDLAINDTIRGFIETASDIDWYRVNNADTAVGMLRLEALAAKKIDLVVTVFNQEEEAMLQINAGGELEPEYLPNLGILPRQVYYFKIENKSKSGNSAEFYSLVTELGRYYNDLEFEFNNSPETASPIFANRSVSGFLHPGGDVDFYQLDLTANSKSLVEAKLIGILKVNTDMILYNHNLVEIARATDRPMEETEKLSAKVDRGIYYLKIFGADARQSNYRDRYRLTTTVKAIY